MKKVSFYPIERWGWECPECGSWHEEEDDPGDQDILICESCGEEFEPESE